MGRFYSHTWFYFALAVSLALMSILAGCGTSGGPQENKLDQSEAASAQTGNTTPSPQGTSSDEGADKPVVLQEVKVPGADAGIELYVRHKALADKSSFSPNKIVLFLEPFSIPSAEAFDVPGYSWMEEFARQGYDTWAMDFRGFGHSTRPSAMEQPATKNKPVVRAEESVKDVSAVVDYIRAQRNVEKISVVGWSWGAVVASMYAAEHPGHVEKLVLYGAMHGFDLPMMAKTYEAPDRPGELNPNMPAYQVIDWDKASHHWHMMLEGKEDLVPKEAWEAVKQVFIASDSKSGTRDGFAVQRPMGPLVDLYYIWSDRPIFDAGRIQAPALVIYGDLDFFADPGFINKLTGAVHKKEVVIKDGTHWVLYEKHRDQLLQETDAFLKGK